MATGPLMRQKASIIANLGLLISDTDISSSGRKVTDHELTTWSTHLSKGDFVPAGLCLTMRLYSSSVPRRDDFLHVIHRPKTIPEREV